MYESIGFVFQFITASSVYRLRTAYLFALGAKCCFRYSSPLLLILGLCWQYQDKAYASLNYTFGLSLLTISQ